MPPKRDQLFSKDTFDSFMADNDDDDVSLGSAGHSRLGGLGGLRAVSPLPSPNKPVGGLGGLGKKTTESSKPARLGGAKLGGIGGAKLGGIGGAKPPELADKMGALTTGEHVNALQAVTSTMKEIAQTMQGLSEKTVLGFQEVSNRLRAQQGEEPSVQESLDALVRNIDEEIAAKGDDNVYVIIPGKEKKTVTTDEVAKLVKGKSVHIFGSVGHIASITSDRF